MKKLITLIIVSINLIALDFGKDVSIVGKWEIKIKDDQFISFLVSAGNRWNVEFKENGYVYKGNIKSETSQIIWQYENKGIVHTKFYAGKSKPKEAFKEFTPITSESYFKIINKTDDDRNICYRIEIIDQEREAIMCRNLNKKEKAKLERERAKKIIKIEMK